nr:GTP-binding protein [Brevundimonas diminuta]
MTPSTLQRDTLRFITCGSVDDGKSTLIGRLLHDVGAVPGDQVAALRDADGRLNFSLLVDGLLAEREQGITIDVAYRYFSTPRRQFIVADTPGHEQYTRNMATGASTADAAVVLIDARKGMLTQSRRHSHIVSLLGVRHIILAVTKMDMVTWSQDALDAIVADYLAFIEAAGLPTPVAIPVSGVNGDNLVQHCEAAEWYAGPTLLQVLETLPAVAETTRPFRMAVQGTNRSNLDFRGYTGRIASGGVAVGDALAVSPSGVRSRVERIVVMGGDMDRAQAGQSVPLTSTDEIDVTRGDILAAANAPLEAADQFEATVVWMAEAELIPGRVYDLKIGVRTVLAQVTGIRHRVNVNTQEKLSARTLSLNDIGICHLSLGQDVAFEPYAVDRAQRAALKGQKPAVAWFTGLSSSGKSTIANLVEERLTAEGCHAYLIDGDNLRHGSQPRPGLHRGRPRREYPLRRRGRANNGRRRPDRPGAPDLALPRRARHGA